MIVIEWELSNGASFLGGNWTSINCKVVLHRDRLSAPFRTNNHSLESKKKAGFYLLGFALVLPPKQLFFFLWNQRCGFKLNPPLASKNIIVGLLRVMMLLSIFLSSHHCCVVDWHIKTTSLVFCECKRLCQSTSNQDSKYGILSLAFPSGNKIVIITLMLWWSRSFVVEFEAMSIV